MQILDYHDLTISKRMNVSSALNSNMSVVENPYVCAASSDPHHHPYVEQPPSSVVEPTTDNHSFGEQSQFNQQDQVAKESIKEEEAAAEQGDSLLPSDIVSTHIMPNEEGRENKEDQPLSLFSLSMEYDSDLPLNCDPDRVDGYLVCPECKHAFSQLHKFRRHWRSHTGEKPFICQECGKGFGRTDKLVRHRNSVHADDRPFICKTCNKAFKIADKLQRHQRSVHSSTFPYSCSDCGKGFKDNTKLNQHKYRIHKDQLAFREQNPAEASHSKKKRTSSPSVPYVCPVCSATYPTLREFNRHSKQHTEQPRPFTCDHCGKGFKRQVHLLHHQKEHDPSRLECSECGRGFFTQDDLNSHLTVHRCPTNLL